MAGWKNRKKPVDLYGEVDSNLLSCWITAFLMGPLALITLVSTLFAGIGFDTVIFVLAVLILSQAIRGIVKLRKLKKSLLEDPKSVRHTDILAAPSFKGLYWFIH
ncbi:hypothetical protein [Microbulbifer sp. 2205BS26-8]|uniref:hypothetical protein n=1 Tax=Microbulbifer sp. 2205BS26-8 TaxID=3064386 RepID=UPI00273EA3AA|nr:hypothetical protein [Microbulbifer sp. 2205BS26-8]MDP5209667.1 hypothetical protein [Microbulbifer sp. 2205BS26-8]